MWILIAAYMIAGSLEVGVVATITSQRGCLALQDTLLEAGPTDEDIESWNVWCIPYEPGRVPEIDA